MPQSLHYYDAVGRQEKSFKKSTYGLITVVYNGGESVMSWDLLSKTMCDITDQMAAWHITQEQLHNKPSTCPAACRSHYQMKCNSYKKMKTSNFIVRVSQYIIKN